MRYKKIVVGTDGSEHAGRARDVALALAKLNRATVTFVHGCVRVDEGTELLAATEAAALEHGVKAKTVLREQPPADAVVEVADETGADLIVLGTRGLSRAQRLLLGSVSMRVAHHAPCDLLLVRAGSEAPYRSVLVATDGSATADRCARKGYDAAAKLGAQLTLLFVGHPSTGRIVLDDTHRTMTGTDDDVPEPAMRIEQGDPAERILDVADAERCELIVMGNKGVTGSARFLLGSVPQKVALHASCDVLIARTDVQTLTELKPGEGGIVKVEGRKVAVYRDDDGEVHALSAKCTHMGCTVGWNPAEKTWDCPCHGSRFGIDGDVVNGPAAKPLPKTFV